MKKQLPHILSLSTVAKSRLFEIQAVELKFSNGIDRTYERFRSFNRDSVMAIAIEGEDLLLIREYAVGKAGWTLVKRPNKVRIVSYKKKLALGQKNGHFYAQ